MDLHQFLSFCFTTHLHWWGPFQGSKLVIYHVPPLPPSLIPFLPPHLSKKTESLGNRKFKKPGGGKVLGSLEGKSLKVAKVLLRA